MNDVLMTSLCRLAQTFDRYMALSAHPDDYGVEVGRREVEHGGGRSIEQVPWGAGECIQF